MENTGNMADNMAGAADSTPPTWKCYRPPTREKARADYDTATRIYTESTAARGRAQAALARADECYRMACAAVDEAAEEVRHCAAVLQAMPEESLQEMVEELKTFLEGCGCGNTPHMRRVEALARMAGQ